MSTIDVRQPTDDQLIAASRFDGVHFATVFGRHAGAVHGYLDRRLGREAADDHLGAAFVSAYAGRRHFRSWEDSARPWLLGVATNVVRKHWRAEQAALRANPRRRAAPVPPIAAVAPVAGAAPVPSSVGRAVTVDPVAAAAVVERLQHLDARDRDVVLLVAWESLGSSAVARALDLPDGVVAARLHGMARQIFAGAPDEAPAGAPAAGDLVGASDGLDLVRALRPAVAPPTDAVLAAAREELRVLAGGPTAGDGPRATSAVAAEHEQLRRWRTGPGGVLSARRPR